MKGIMLISIAAAMLLPTLLMADLPTCYHTYAQIQSELLAHQQSHPDIAKVYTIGYSQQDSIPIYAMKISDNVELDEDEPALLFVGQVHAEEVLGVQITLGNISEILASRYQPPYTQWISQLDLWFIPTLNPEGHNVVTSNMDITFRKNKRDNNLNGIFDYLPNTGYDLDGVDINRNFDFNWIHGDSLWAPGSYEVYDYYRGPAPMSESETRALKNLCDQKKFIYSVCWHSSRTGNFSEKLYYPFNWKDERPSPDLSFAATIGNAVAAQIVNEAGTGTYEPSANLSRKGAYHDWMYQQYGTIAMLIECGTRNLQPDSLLMVSTIQRCSNGVRWLINRSLMFSSAVPSSAMMNCRVLDAVTNQPLEAEVIVQQHHAPWFRPRLTNPTTGKLYRPLAMGNYSVKVRKRGYYDAIINNVNIMNTTWTPVNVNLTPKPTAVMDISIWSGIQLIPATVVIGGDYPITINTFGHLVYFNFTGEYPITVYASGYYPYVGTVTLAEGINHLNFNLSTATVLFSENWESSTASWQIEGPWVRQNSVSENGYAITDSWGGDGLYAMNCDVWIKTVNPITLPTGTGIYLGFDSLLYTEWDFDPVRVEISPDGENWEQIWIKSGRWDLWNREFVSLADYAGQSLYFRFRLTDVSSDDELTDPGWTIDNIAIITGSSSDTVDINIANPQVTVLHPNFPNPFNPQTTISFSLKQPSRTTVKIYNLKGQMVRTLLNGSLDKGTHKLVFDGKDDSGRDVGSGIYLYRLETDHYTRSMKMVLLK